MSRKKQPRIVAYVGPDTYVEGAGYRVSLVVEGEHGHHPTGTWPYHGGVGETRPWFWGPTLEDAERAAVQYNEQRGISAKDAAVIVALSMVSPGKRRKRSDAGKRRRA